MKKLFYKIEFVLCYCPIPRVYLQMIFSREKREKMINAAFCFNYNEFIFKSVTTNYGFFDKNIMYFRKFNCLSKIRELLSRNKMIRNRRDNFDMINKNACYIMFVPYYQKRENQIRKALDAQPCVIGLIPEEMIKPDMILSSVKHSKRSLLYMSEEMMTIDAIMSFVHNNPYCIEFIPEHLLTNEIIKRAIGRAPRTIRLIPEGLLTDDIIRIAIDSENYVCQICSKLVADR